MVTILQTPSTTFETSLRALPHNWYERVHSWSSVEETRLNGAIELVLQAGISSPAALLLLLEDNSFELRIRVAALLVTGHLRPEQASIVLLRILTPPPDPYSHSANEQLRLAACEAMGLLGKRRLVWPLLAIFKDPAASDKLAEQAALAIGRLGSRNCTKPFIESLSGSPNPLRRKAAAKGLEMALNEGRLKDERIMQPLLLALTNETELLAVRCAVAAALYCLKDTSENERMVLPLLKLMDDKSEPIELRQATTQALGNTKAEQAIASLLARLEDQTEDLNLRRNAAWALVMIGNQKAVPALLNLMQQQIQSQTEPEPGGIRAAVINTLGWLYSPAAVEPLIARLQDHSEPASVRASSAQALGMIGDSRALKPLLAALKDGTSVEVRHSAAYGLGQLGDERAIGALEEVVAHDEGEVAHYGDTDYSKIRVCTAQAIETIRQGGG